MSSVDDDFSAHPIFYWSSGMKMRRRISMGLVAALAVAGLPVLEAKSPARLPWRGWTSWGLSAIKGHAKYGREWLTAENVLAQSEAMVSSRHSTRHPA